MVLNMLRSPIVCVLAHVDHGKTSILDRIRGTAIAAKEAGGITQMICASYIPKEAIISACGPLKDQAEKQLKVPGLLFIDTPGHEAFTSMRERGGSIADIAILVIDIMQGIQPQTIESLQILRSQKTPFVVVLNKIDLLNGWKSQQTPCVLDSIAAQAKEVQNLLEEKTYAIVGKLSELGFEAERFDRVSDFTKQLVIIPFSAKTGEGMAELLLYLAGLSQRYLASELKEEPFKPAKGSILEVKEEKGLGTTIDVIIYSGTLRKNDNIAFCTAEGAKIAKVRAILRPPHPGETLACGSKYIYLDQVHAAAGVKIYAPGLEGALAGSPIEVVAEDKLNSEIEKEINSQVCSILIKDEKIAGVVLKADTLGSAEALMQLLKNSKIPIRSIGIGPVNKKDVVSARAAALEDKYCGVVLAFNVPVLDEAKEESAKGNVRIFSSDVIYRLIEDYQNWVKEEKEKDQKIALSAVALPAKFVALANCCFRVSKPAIFGVEVIAGRLRPGVQVMNSQGKIIGVVKEIQDKGKSLEMLAEKQQAAISMDEPYCGKTFKLGEELYAFVPKEHAERLRKSQLLSEKELALLEEIQKIAGVKMI
jgi:translation initiation factor 5B